MKYKEICARHKGFNLRGGNMRLFTALLSIALACSGLTAGHAAEWSRWHFGIKACVEAPNGECGDAFQVCKSCDQPAKPEILRTNVTFEALAQAGFSSKGKANSCYRKELSLSPSWISTAIWVDQRSEIMVVDPNRNQVLLYAVTGQGTKLPAELGKQAVESNVKASESYIIKMVGPSGMVFDGNLAITEPDVNLQKSRSGKSNGLGSLFDWVVSGSRLFAFGSVKGEAGPPKSGFIDAEIGMKPLVIEDVQLRVPFDYLDYYLLGHAYVASVSNRGFFLKMDSTARIFRFPKGSNESELLNVMPSELTKVPRIKNPALGPEDTKNLFKEITTYQIPVGIYGFQGMLYLLGRSPSDRKTTWWLYQIDPEREKVVARLRLPVFSEHVTLVPSPSFWFIFEKGEVKEDSTQDIKSLVAIPTNWIVDASSSPLRGHAVCVSSGRYEG